MHTNFKKNSRQLSVLFVTNLIFATTFVSGSLTAHALMQKNESSLLQTVRSQILDETSLTQDPSIIHVIRLDYASLDVVPPQIRQYTGVTSAATNTKAVSVYLSLTNDYNFLRVVGLKNKADDFGDTHATSAAIAGYLPNGMQLKLDMSTHLYTQPIAGTYTVDAKGESNVDQWFTNDNLVRLVLDSAKNKSAYYWRAEVGWEQLDSSHTSNLLDASKQQLEFHTIVNRLAPGTTKHPTYIENGKGSRDGYFIGVYAGLASQKHQIMKICSSNLYADLGTRQSELKNASYYETNQGAVLSCVTGKKNTVYQFDLGNRVRKHAEGYQYTPYLDFSAGRVWKFGVRVEQSYGDLMNYVDYNLPNVYDNSIDPIYTFYIKRN